MSFICHIHNYTEYNEEWNVFSAFNPSKCTHLEQWAGDCAVPGEQSWTSCRSRDSNPQPWVTSGFKSNALSIRPWLPRRKSHLTYNKQNKLLCVPHKKVSHGCESDKQCQIFLTSQLSLLPLFSTVAERAQYAANRKNTCKLSKQLPQFDNIHVKNARNTTKQRNALQMLFFIWLCCEHLHWWRCFLDLLALFLFACVFRSCSTLSSLGHVLFPHFTSSSLIFHWNWEDQSL